MSMKYYVYISDTKVDMLYSQIPQNILRKIAAELNINLGIFSLSVKGKENEEKTRYEKLKLVVNYIENNMDVGTVDQPKAYFKGSLPMQWRRLVEGLVYFAGRTSETILGLAGSMRHVIGNLGAESRTSVGHSGLPSIMEVLREKFGLPLDEQGHVDSHVSGDDLQETLATVAISTTGLSGSQQHLEFLAKRLVEGSLSLDPFFILDTEENQHVVLGTPLYVAMAD
jgi:hypothetical protein